jgi:hypothetical protein
LTFTVTGTPASAPTSPPSLKPGVDDVGGRQRFFGTMINHRVDRVIDVIQPVESGLHRFPRRDLAGPDQAGKLGCRQLPQHEFVLLQSLHRIFVGRRPIASLGLRGIDWPQPMRRSSHKKRHMGCGRCGCIQTREVVRNRSR